MLSKEPVNSIFEKIGSRTIEALGIEVIGSVIVAIGFILLRDANREKIDSLERKIVQLQDTQAQLLVLAMMATAQNQNNQSAPVSGAQNNNAH